MYDGSIHLAFIGPGGPEVLIIMLALLVMFGAKDAPRIFRKLNEMLNRIRSTAENFKHEVMYGDLKNEPGSGDEVGEYDDYGQGVQEDSGSNEAEVEEAGLMEQLQEDAAAGEQDVKGERDEKSL